MPQFRPEDLTGEERDALGRIHRHENVADHLREALKSHGLIEQTQSKWTLTNEGSVALATIGLQKLDE